MKKITRRLLAFALCAALALCAPCALAQEGLMAQIVINMEDGTQQVLPVQMVPGSAGDTVYWLDTSMVTPEQAAVLAAGWLVVTNEAGDVLLELPMADSGFEPGHEGFVELYDEAAEKSNFMLIVPMPVPEDMAETLVVLDDYGYIGEELYAEYDVEEDEEEYSEEYSEEEYEEEAYEEYEEDAGEAYIEEGYIEEDPDAYDETGDEYEEYEEYDDVTGEIAPPQYAVPYGEAALRSDMAMDDGNVLAFVSAADLLTVYDYAEDETGAIWWLAQDYRTGREGYIASNDVFEVEEEQAEASFARIDMEIEAELAAEEAAAAEAERLEAERIAAEEAAAEAERLEAERLADEESARLAAEREAEEKRLAEEAAAAEAARLEAEAIAAAEREAERIAAVEREAERLAAEQAAAEAERLAAEQAAAEAERLAAEQESEQTEPVRYAVTSNKNSNT
ncbi:MAG: hypothetical protein IJO02_09695, partial [Clostridia bacterium]|nr:hypothetical protein [Clostridia bacterium]